MGEQVQINPFQKIIDTYRQAFPDKTTNSYPMSALIGCLKQYNHFLLTYYRLELDRLITHRHLKLVKELINKPYSDISETEHFAYSLYVEGSQYVEIDYESFIFHSKILMDRIAYASCFFFHDIITEELDFGFAQNFDFTKLTYRFENEPRAKEHRHKDYVNYVLNKTDWYEQLHFARNKFVAHGLPYILGFEIDEKERLKITHIPSDPERNKYLEAIRALAKKYAKFIDVNNPMELFEISFWLERMDLSDADAKLLKGVHPRDPNSVLSRVGGILPDHIELANNIVVFANFSSNYFTDRIQHIQQGV